MPVRSVLVLALRLCGVAATCFPDGDYVDDDLGSKCIHETACDGPTCCCYRQKNCVGGVCECGEAYTISSNCFDCSPGYYSQASVCIPCAHCDRDGTQMDREGYDPILGWPKVQCNPADGTCYCKFGWRGARCEHQDSPPSPPVPPPPGQPIDIIDSDATLAAALAWLGSEEALGQIAVLLFKSG